jgi:hypothetical protein
VHELGCDALPGRHAVGSLVGATRAGRRAPGPNRLATGMVRRIALGSIFVVAAAAGPGPAAGHEGDGRAEVLPAQVAAGEPLTVRGADLTPGAMAEVRLVTAGGGIPLGATTVAEDGSISLEVVVPTDVAARYYELHVSDATGLELAGYVEVVAEDSAGGTPGAAESAGPPGWILWAAGGLALAVAVAAAASSGSRDRRRRI